jgi:drug/metabolite transporter (DMT)-like permease
MVAGLIFAFLALFSWGFGDFSIQKAVRSIGIWKSLFVIGIVGVVGIFPFILGELPTLATEPKNIGLLALAGLVVFFTALFEFESLRRGKLAIVEPVLGLELPITVALSMFLWGEELSLPQLLLVGTTFIGVVLAVTIHHTHLHYHRRILERGVILAGVGAIGMGLFNFLVGVGSQETSPLMTIWFTNCVFTLLCLAYLSTTGQIRTLVADIRAHILTMFAVSILDNAAWVFFAFSVSFIPISIAITVSESYIALTVLLGVFVSHERLKYHQIVGVVIALASVLLLSGLTAGR